MTLTAADLVEALGPAETQYAVEQRTVESSLLRDPQTQDTTQDNWTFVSPVADNPVRIEVDGASILDT